MPSPIHSVRLPADLWRNVSLLVKAMQRDPMATLHGAVTHSTVVREALTRGLAELEQQYLGKPGATP